MKKKVVLYFLITFVFLFSFSNYLILQLLSVKKIKATINTTNEYEVLIQKGVLHLDRKYLIKNGIEAEELLFEYQNNIISINYTFTNYNNLWESYNKGVKGHRLYSDDADYVGSVLKHLQNVKITAADVYSKGTQLKLLLTLEGNQKAIFKPQWYKIDEVITGTVYSGKDRFNSEIVAFYLAAILNFHSVPISAERYIKINSELVPVSTPLLLKTVDVRDSVWCVYGVCHYCNYNEPVCEGPIGLRGALILHLPGKIKWHRSPWQRKYRKNALAEWQINNNYCSKVKEKLSTKRILDLVDTSIFDFILQNGDRHHYETINDRIVLLDSGKGLGNPNIHHLDILAPLYQCCFVRQSTWSRLKELSGSKLTELLKYFLSDFNLITDLHLKAMEERLLLIYSAVEFCFQRYEEKDVLF